MSTKTGIPYVPANYRVDVEEHGLNPAQKVPAEFLHSRSGRLVPQEPLHRLTQKKQRKKKKKPSKKRRTILVRDNFSALILLTIEIADAHRTRTSIFCIGFYAGFGIPTGDLVVFLLRAGRGIYKLQLVDYTLAAVVYIFIIKL